MTATTRIYILSLSKAKTINHGGVMSVDMYAVSGRWGVCLEVSRDPRTRQEHDSEKWGFLVYMGEQTNHASQTADFSLCVH